MTPNSKSLPKARSLRKPPEYMKKLTAKQMVTDHA